MVTGLVAGFLAGRLVWLLARPLLRQPAFLRLNYRGRTVPTGGGHEGTSVAETVIGSRLNSVTPRSRRSSR